MTNEFKKVIEKVGKLSEEKQKELAKLLEDELRWNESFQNTQNELNLLAEDAVNEYNKGKTEDDSW